MENARIIRLGGSGSTNVVASTFEEAFGDWSEARGKGRARRAARQADRRAKRKERKLGRIEDRDEVKRARKEGRIQRRLDRKSMRQQGREARRDERVGRRMGRKMYKAEEREARRGLREPQYEEDMMATEDQGYAQPGDQQLDAGYDQGYDQGYGEEAGYSEDYGSVDEPMASPGGGSGANYQYGEDEWQPPVEETEYDDEGAYWDENEYYDPTFDESEEYEDVDYDTYGYFNDEVKEGKVTIDPIVLDTARKLEWNRELVIRLGDRRDEMAAVGSPTTGIEKQIEERKDRMAELKADLDDFFSADGKANPKRKAMVKMAVGKARKEMVQTRNAAKRTRMNEMKMEKMRRRGRKHGGSETPVEADLSPEFGPQRIVIPPKQYAMNAKGTDETDTDASDYYGETPVPTRVVELSSNFGETGAKSFMSKINWTGVAIGVGVAAVAIYFIRKNNLIK